jgi:glycosyltransferase involved in cell wall biosynthesis
MFSQDGRGAPIVGAMRRSVALARALRHEAGSTDIVHSHGLWLMPNIYAGRESARAGKPLVVSPRGMLSPAALTFGRWKKRAFWQLLQERSVRGAACIHATSLGEYRDIREFGLRNPVAVIPNGIDVIPLSNIQAANGEKRTVLSLGRVHPKKGLDRLLQAWAKLESKNPDWRLVIAGPAEAGHDGELLRLASSLGLRHAELRGAIYGEEKFEAFRGADLFVLPSLSENFGLTVAESLAAGTPVIVTKGAPWSALDAEGCGWWIDHGVEPLAASLQRAMAMPRVTLKAMGFRGRGWMERDFSWDRVSSDMLEVYRWLRSGDPPPSSVRLD